MAQQMELTKSHFLHSSLVLSYARNMHFSEYPGAVGRGFHRTAGTVSLITQERIGLKWPSYKSLLITLIIVQWWKEGRLNLPYGESGTLHVIWTFLKNWAPKVIGLFILYLVYYAWNRCWVFRAIRSTFLLTSPRRSILSVRWAQVSET